MVARHTSPENSDFEIMSKAGSLRSRTNGNHVPNGASKVSSAKTNGTNGTAQNGHAATAQKPSVSSWKAFSDKWEVPRKVFHSSIGFVTLVLYLIRTRSIYTIINPLSVFLVIVISADVLRLNHAPFEKLYEKVLGPLMREQEKTSVNGVVFYLIGVIFVLYFYPRDVAVCSILFLAWADTAASTVGRMYGAYTPKLPSRIFGLKVAGRKSLAGFLGSFGTAFGITTVFYTVGLSGMRGDLPEPVWSLSQPKTGGVPGLLVLAVLSGLATSTAEVLDLGALDDNVSLPILSGGALLATSKLLAFVSSY